MKRLPQWLALAGVAVALIVSAGQVQAQGRGNFDPEQMRQRMMERYKEAMEVKNDAEWKLIEERITKVSEARREVGFGGRGMMMGGRRGGGPGGDQAGGRGGSGAEANPEADALQKALEAKASTEEIKAKLSKFREARKTKEANLAKAREELKKVLTVRQEASAVMLGLLE
jgi:hypothetical protein